MNIRRIVITVLIFVGAAPPLLGWSAASRSAPAPRRSEAPATTATVSDAAPPAQKISILQAAVLGIVEGITEYLPVSSTGHLILAGRAMGLKDSPAADAFEIVIQLGAILAVVGLYRKRVGQMALGAVGKNPSGLRLLGLLIVAFLPAAVTGKLFHKQIQEHLFGPVPVLWALAVGGVLMIVVEYFFWSRRKDAPRVTQVDQTLFWQALAIGMAQCLAMWPGTSRSMITMLAALVVGLDMVAAAEFSFLLALPTLGAATLYSVYKDWDALQASAGPLGMLVGLAVSGIVAALAVKGFVKWLTRHGLMPFGVYRILLAAVLYWYLMK